MQYLRIFCLMVCTTVLLLNPSLGRFSLWVVMCLCFVRLSVVVVQSGAFLWRSVHWLQCSICGGPRWVGVQLWSRFTLSRVFCDGADTRWEGYPAVGHGELVIPWWGRSTVSRVFPWWGRSTPSRVFCGQAGPRWLGCSAVGQIVLKHGLKVKLLWSFETNFQGPTKKMYVKWIIV